MQLRVRAIRPRRRPSMWRRWMSAELFRDPETGEIMARFFIGPYEEADEVSVVGSFNDWTPGVDVLVPGEDGSRTAVVRINHPGDVHFRYLATGGRWFDDPDADAITEHGGTLFRVDEELADTDPTARATTARTRAPRKAPAKKAEPAAEGRPATPAKATKAAKATKPAKASKATPAKAIKSAAGKAVKAATATKASKPGKKSKDTGFE
jgi:hypothetical protein